MFDYSECSFKIEKSKESTARIVVFKMGILNSYTLECSFFGSSNCNNPNDKHMSIKDLENIGRDTAFNTIFLYP